MPRKINSRKIKIETRKLVNLNQIHDELYVFKKRVIRYKTGTTVL